MWKYLGRRALASIPVLLLASILIFLLVREFGADPARVHVVPHGADMELYCPVDPDRRAAA